MPRPPRRPAALAPWLLLLGLAAAWPAARAAGREVLVWGADDCLWCQRWKASDRPDDLKALPAAPALVAARKARLDQPASRYEFPAGMTPPALDQRPTLLPSFDFLCDGRLVRRLTGVASWDSYWHEAARQLARECPDKPL